MATSQLTPDRAEQLCVELGATAPSVDRIRAELAPNGQAERMAAARLERAYRELGAALSILAQEHQIL